MLYSFSNYILLHFDQQLVSDPVSWPHHVWSTDVIFSDSFQHLVVSPYNCSLHFPMDYDGEYSPSWLFVFWCLLWLNASSKLLPILWLIFALLLCFVYSGCKVLRGCIIYVHCLVGLCREKNCPRYWRFFPFIFFTQA